MAIGIQGFAGFGRSAGNIGNIDNSYQLDEGMYLSARNPKLPVRRQPPIPADLAAECERERARQLDVSAAIHGAVGGECAGPARPPGADRQLFRGLPPRACRHGQMVGLPLIPYRFTQYNPYFQDTWKVSPELHFELRIAWFLSTIPEPVGWARRSAARIR